MATTSNVPAPQVSQDDSATIPALVVTNFFNNATPQLAKLADLSAFAQVQFSYYSSLGVGKPLLGPYEAIGRAFAEEPSFQTKYGSLGSNFIATAYQDVFGRAATTEQVAHFQAQIDYFVSIYVGAGIPPANALSYAQGAVIGQMLGHAVTEGGSVFDYAGAAEAYIAQMDTAGFVPGRPLSNFADGGTTPPPATGGGGGGGGGTPPAPAPDATVGGKTIQEAIDAAAAGSTIRVGAGEFDENVAITKNVTVVFDAGTVLKGGFAVASGVSNFTVSGGKIDGGLDAAVAGITSASENNSGIYAQGSSTINVSGVQFTGNSAATRGLIGATGEDAKFVVNGGSFSGLLTGIYLNPGNDAQITGASFSGNTAAIGGVSSGTKLGISGSTFASNAEDLGIEGQQKIEALTLQGNVGLSKINIYDGGVHQFKVGDLSAQNVFLVGAGGSIGQTIAVANENKILLGGGVHNETLNIMSKVNIEGVGGAVLTGSGQSTITLYDAADGSTISNLKIVATPTSGGSALVSAYGPEIKNVTLSGNTFDAGYNTAGSVVYLNPGADGWVIKNNTFVGQHLTASPLLGIQGSGHQITGNSFGAVGGSYPKVESFTPSVVFSGNTGLETIFKAGAFEYEQHVVSVSNLTGAGRTEAAHGTVTLADSGSLGRATSLFLDSDNGSGRLRFNELFDQPNEPSAFKLSDLKLLQFDFRMQQEPSANPSHAPVVRLWIDVDGNVATNDTAELVAEWVYQGGASPSKTEWNTFDIASAKLWQRSNGTNFDQISNLKTINEWTAGNNKPTFGTASGVDIGPNSKVIGYSVAFGSGNGSAEYYVDNLAVGFAGSAGNTGSVYLYSFG